MLEIVDAHTSLARIKVFGVGGGGSNAVNRMIQAGLSGVEFWISNTDLQALEQAMCTNRLQIGHTVTRGLGAGGDPEIGRLSAEEDREAIAEVLRGADMAFITAGMGGGTGTGAAPVVAEVARDLGILTVAIVTKPFSFEGKKKMARALSGLAELGQYVDTLIAIPNQKLLNVVEPGTPFLAAMLVADEVLFQATRGISDLITGHGEINLDFADVKTVMRNRGNALLGCGVASGKDRAIEAAQGAVSSPLLEEVSILGAEALLINVQGGPGMTLKEAAEAAEFISERVGEEADIFWGAVVDPTLEDEMRVTLIATGFPRTESRVSPGDEVSAVSQRRADQPIELLGRGWSDPRRERPAERPAPSREPAEIFLSSSGPRLELVPSPEERFSVSSLAPETPVAAAEPTPQARPEEVTLASEEMIGDLLTPPWSYRGGAEDEIFLRREEPSRDPAPRVSGAPAPWDHPLRSEERAEPPRYQARRPPVIREESGLDSRLGRRNPLDEPTFMRKRMD